MCFAYALLAPALAFAHPGHGTPGESPIVHLLTVPEHAIGIYLAVILGVGFAWLLALRDWRS
jgi:hypothetical protein